MDKESKQNRAIEKQARIKADFTYLLSFNYKITKEIGRGGYGVVYKAQEIKNPDYLRAIKINFNTVSRELIYSEMAFLMLIKDRPHLPKLKNIFVYHDICHIVLEYFKCKPFITYFNTFSIYDIKHYLYKLLSGLKELKSMGIYHRDIKPANFLYNPETRQGTIVDFGLAEIDMHFRTQLEAQILETSKVDPNHPDLKAQKERLTIYKKLTDCLNIIGRNKIGTETYMPLESILHYEQQSYSSDIWPVGVIMLQFVTRKYNVFNSVKMVNKPAHIKNPYYINYLIELATFFGSEAVIKQCQKLEYNLRLPSDIDRYTFKQVQNIEGYDEVADDLLNSLLCLDASKRITVENALQHQFFHEIREQFSD